MNDNGDKPEGPTGQILQFKLRCDTGSYLEGQADCVDCDHEWRAVSSIGTRAIECPNCGGMGGRFRHRVIRGNGLYRCNCGSIDLRANRDFVYCSACGMPMSFD